ncbi:MAG TPA: YihY family inner membrane protein [Burkholderiales bacterium]
MNQITRLFSFLNYMACRARQDRLKQVAASLTFTTLLSLVPLIAIAMAGIAAFPAFEGLAVEFKIFLLTTMVPETAGKVITVYMAQFAAAAGRLTALGTAFLAVTAMMLMLTIEDVFNSIWRVTQRRPMVQRLLMYWAVLTIGPLLVGASLSLTSWLVSSSLGLVKEVPALGELMLKVVPGIFSTLAFTLLFIAVPYRHVPWRHALIGGAVAAVGFELMKRGFAMYVSTFPTHRLIYGAFASIPIFLLWVYLSWLVVLLGALLTAALSAPPARRRGTAVPGERLDQALHVLKALCESMRTGELVTVPKLAGHLGLEYEEVEDILGRLGAARWVRKAVGDGWVLVREPDQIRVAEVLRLFAFRHEPGGAGRARDERIESVLAAIDSRMNEELAMSLRQLFSEPRPVESRRAGQTAP